MIPPNTLRDNMFTNEILDVINYSFKFTFLMEDKTTLRCLEALNKSCLSQ